MDAINQSKVPIPNQEHIEIDTNELVNQIEETGEYSINFQDTKESLLFKLEDSNTEEPGFGLNYKSPMLSYICNINYSNYSRYGYGRFSFIKDNYLYHNQAVYSGDDIIDEKLCIKYNIKSNLIPNYLKKMAYDYNLNQQSNSKSKLNKLLEKENSITLGCISNKNNNYENLYAHIWMSEEEDSSFIRDQIKNLSYNNSKSISNFYKLGIPEYNNFDCSMRVFYGYISNTLVDEKNKMHKFQNGVLLNMYNINNVSIYKGTMKDYQANDKNGFCYNKKTNVIYIGEFENNKFIKGNIVVFKNSLSKLCNDKDLNNTSQDYLDLSMISTSYETYDYDSFQEGRFYSKYSKNFNIFEVIEKYKHLINFAENKGSFIIEELFSEDVYERNNNITQDLNKNNLEYNIDDNKPLETKNISNSIEKYTFISFFYQVFIKAMSYAYEDAGFDYIFSYSSQMHDKTRNVSELFSSLLQVEDLILKGDIKPASRRDSKIFSRRESASLINISGK